MIRSGLPPGSTTMAFLEIGSPMIVQLHCNGPTGKVSRISAGLGTVMSNPGQTAIVLLQDSTALADTERQVSNLTPLIKK